MPVLRQHDPNSPDPLIRPMVPASDQIRRLVWRMVWLVLCRWTPNPLHEWRCFVLRLFGARIGRSNFIYPSAKIWAPWRLETEDVVTISPDVSVYNVGGMRFGHHSIVSEGAYLCGATHDFKDPTFPMVSRPVVIGPCAWVCARAVVLPGVTVGEGAVLGAAAVAARNLEAWGVYAGNPARLAGRRDPASAPLARGE
jgi:putative colanic acid biosynthesis acetyltransferase WcaF